MSDSNSFTFHLARNVCCLCDAVLPSTVSTKCQHCPYMYCNPPKMVYNWSNPWQELSTGWFLCDICQSYCQLLCLMPHIKAMVEMFKWFCFCELYKETQTYQYTNPINGIIFWDLWNFIYIYNYIYPENNIFIDLTKEGNYVPASIRYNFPDYQGRLVH